MSSLRKESSPNRKVSLTITGTPEEILDIFAVRMRVASPDLETALVTLVRFVNKLYEEQGRDGHLETVENGRVVDRFRLPS